MCSHTLVSVLRLFRMNHCEEGDLNLQLTAKSSRGYKLSEDCISKIAIQHERTEHIDIWYIVPRATEASPQGHISRALTARLRYLE